MTDQELRLQCVALANTRAHDQSEVIALAQEIYGFIMDRPVPSAQPAQEVEP